MAMRAKPVLLTALLLAVAGIGLAVATLPGLRPDKPGIVATLALIAALALGGWRYFRNPGLSMLLVVAAALVMVPMTVIARAFGRVDMMALMFHVEFGTEGATLVGLESEILAAVLSMLFVVLALWLLKVIWALGPRSAVLAALGLLAVNPVVQFAAVGLGRASVDSGLAERLANPVPQAGALGGPDLVVIYLEGLERRYGDTAIWGDAYAPLAELAREGLEFTDIGQSAGTGWSLAGMVASQCGVPLVANGFRFKNNYTEQTDFLTNRTCLGDVLSARGYGMEYIVGGDLEFAGINHFYASHGVTSQLGKRQIEALHPADFIAKATIDWVLDDELIFETAKARYGELATGAAPVALFVETIGPHGATAYLSRRCSDDGQARKSGDLARVVRCTSDDTHDAVRTIQAEAAARGRDLRIVLMSDHLSHHVGDPEWERRVPRRNTVIFLGGAGAGSVNDRAGTMVDVYPTLLDWLGFAARPVRGGLGVSLLSEQHSLVAELSLEAFDEALMFDPALSTAIWR